MTFSRTKPQLIVAIIMAHALISANNPGLYQRRAAVFDNWAGNKNVAAMHAATIGATDATPSVVNADVDGNNIIYTYSDFDYLLDIKI